MLNKYRLKHRTIYAVVALCLRGDSTLTNEQGHTIARHTYEAPAFRAILEHNVTSKHLALNVWQMNNGNVTDVAAVARLNHKGIQLTKYNSGLWGLQARQLCADSDVEAKAFVHQYIDNVMK